jgi:hypothetical protein
MRRPDPPDTGVMADGKRAAPVDTRVAWASETHAPWFVIPKASRRPADPTP